MSTDSTALHSATQRSVVETKLSHGTIDITYVATTPPVQTRRGVYAIGTELSCNSDLGTCPAAGIAVYD